MEPHDRIERCIFQWEKWLLKLCGHNFIGEPYKPNLITFFVYGLLTSAVVNAIYTIVYYDISAKLFCLTLLLMMIQVNIYFICCENSN